MLDIKLIRERADFVRQRLASRGAGEESPVARCCSWMSCGDRRWARARRSRRCAIARPKKSAALIAQRSLAEAEAKKQEVRVVGEQIASLDQRAAETEAARNRVLLRLPNLPHESVPAGSSAEQNVVVRTQGEEAGVQFQAQIARRAVRRLGLVDFDRATKLAGSGFVLYTGWGARLERALIQFMLDLHTREHGCTEVSPPFMVGPQCLEGVGQFPKFKDQYYGVAEGDEASKLGKLYLIPTAETPVANIHREEILKESELPRRYCAYTPCFRGEAGAAGVGTRGMIRVHQFDKVELISIVKPRTVTPT